MNELTARLRKLAALLDDKGAELEGKRWNAAVTAFGRTLVKFEGAAEDAARGLAPGLRELSKILESPDKKLFDEAVLKKLFKDVLDDKPPKDVPAAKQRAAFLTGVKDQGNAKKALTKVQDIIAELKAPKEKPPKDADKLRLELHRLGTLDDDQRAYELAKRFSDKSDLKRLAEAAGLPIPKDAKKEAIAAAVLTAAKRVAGHTI